MTRLVSGLVFLLGLTAAIRAEDPNVEFHQEPGRLRITADGAPVATYVYQDATIPRPHFSHLFGPGGVQLSRNHPPIAGKDPVDHADLHPGLWLAFGDLSGSDSWRNKAPVEHEAFVEPPTGGEGRGSFVVRNAHRRTSGGAIYAREVGRVTVVARPSGYLLALQSEFTPVDGDLVFGDQEEMGLGFRVATPLAVKAGGRIVDAEGDRDEKGVRGKATAWCDYSGVLDGHWAGASLIPDPANFRESWFHVRDYGLAVANPFGRKALTKGTESRVVVKPGETLKLGFGVFLHASPSAEPIDPSGFQRVYLEELSRRPAPAKP